LKDYLKFTIRYMPLGEGARAMVITSRSGRVSLNPTWYESAQGFVRLGIAHILGGVDHLLFLVCLLIPVRGLREVIPIVTAFTVAHSVTLFGAAYGLTPAQAWFPPFVETVIAVSILYVALENIAGPNLRRRWLTPASSVSCTGSGSPTGSRRTCSSPARISWSRCSRSMLASRSDSSWLCRHAASSRPARAIPARWAHRHDHPLGADREPELGLDD
jgi:HupE / UreJ protein